MALIRCTACRAATPASSIACVHCGTLAPACTDCRGSGRCSDCGTTAAYDMTGSECAKCGGSVKCPSCAGAKRRWPAAAV